MKEKSKVILGTALGFVLGGALSVGASTAVQAWQNDQISITFNGKQQAFVDETTGEKMYPITYNDRTYLPLRNVANLVGLNVSYDDATKTAKLATDDYKEFLEGDKENYAQIMCSGYMTMNDIGYLVVDSIKGEYVDAYILATRDEIGAIYNMSNCFDVYANLTKLDKNASRIKKYYLNPDEDNVYALDGYFFVDKQGNVIEEYITNEENAIKFINEYLGLPEIGGKLKVENVEIDIDNYMYGFDDDNDYLCYFCTINGLETRIDCHNDEIKESGKYDFELERVKGIFNDDIVFKCISATKK